MYNTHIFPVIGHVAALAEPPVATIKQVNEHLHLLHHTPRMAFVPHAMILMLCVPQSCASATRCEFACCVQITPGCRSVAPTRTGGRIL